MIRSQSRIASVVIIAVLGLHGPAARAQNPDHPVITEVFSNPLGITDGPVGRDPANLHQEYIEIYLPTVADLALGLNKDALNLTFYEIEGDFTSSGAGLVNYRIDLPTFDLDPSNGITPGAIARPTSGAVVIGWVDYVGNPPTDLAGTPSTRVAMINGGITEATDFVFIAMNGAQFTETTNFPVPLAISSIDLPNEATSGIIQNGSGALLLVNRDAPGYVELYDDKHIPAGGSANPSLAMGNVLMVSALLDGLAANDHAKFDVLLQPYIIPTGKDIDLENELPFGGAFSLIVPQIDESKKHGYARLFVDLVKTSEDGIPFNEDPVADATGVYRTISNIGPLSPTPGRVHFTNSAPELSVADAPAQIFDVLAGTTGRPGVVCANAGGHFGMQATAAPGASSNPAVMTTATAAPATVLTGQTPVYPQFAATVPAGVADGSMATAAMTVTATNTTAGDPAVVNPNGSTTITIRAINPTQGQDANLLPFQATAFVALQGLPDDPAAPNEFVSTSLFQFVTANIGGLVDDERNNWALLMNPATDLSDPILSDVMEDDMPTNPLLYINFPAAAVGLDDLVTTVFNSAEQFFGNKTYDNSFNGTHTLLKAVELNIAETMTNGGTFTPTERIYYANALGAVAVPNSGLSDVTTTNGFELALLDSNVQQFGTLETGKTDDFGLIVEVGQVGAGASVVTGEFVFLSYTGGLEGADIDSVDVPPHGNQTVIIYVDLEPLNTVLGCETITRLFVVDGNGGSEINIIEAFSLNALPPCPRFTQQPQAQTACPGDPITFTVASDATPPLTYQWRKNGIDIFMETGSSYMIPAAQAIDAGTYDVKVTAACGFNISSPATLTVASAPSITAQPQAQTVCEGAAVTLTVGAAGSTPLNYQWRKGTTPIAGANSPTYSIASAQSADVGSYNVVVSNTCGSVTSAAAALTVNAGPSITSQPQSQTVCPGTAATFTITANGTGPLSYQWVKGITDINGATGSTYTIPAAQTGDAGNYSVVISNVCGTLTSSTAALTVRNNPSINTEPQSQSACSGTSVTLTVIANGPAPLTYQWQKGVTTIAGANSASLTINPAQASDAGAYDVVVTSSCGTSITSNPAMLTINTPPVITQHPASQGLCAGNPVTMSVIATGTPPFSYEWHRDGSLLSGATSPSLTISAAQPGDAGSYDVLVTNTCGSVTSSAAMLTVNTAPAITTPPQNLMACPGGSATFTVLANGTGPLNYQWRRNEVNMGVDSPALTTSQAGSYDVIITNICGTVTSSAASLTFGDTPTIVTPPQAQSTCPGGNATFSVVANGPQGLTYQWWKGKTKILGATGSSHTINAAQAGNVGSYHVVVTSHCGGGAVSVTSNPAMLSLSSGPSITSHPVGQTLCEGGSVTFTVSTNGTPPLSYQWQQGGTPIPGATGTTYTIPASQATDAGAYTVVVTNDCGTVTSSTASLIVNTPPVITVQPQGQMPCNNGSATFTVVANGTPPLSYQWRKVGAGDISGATGATLTISNAQNADAAAYDVVITNACGTVTSSPATLSLGTTPTILSQPATQTACTGDSVTFTATANGSSPLSYQWRKGGVDIPAATNASFTIPASQASDAGAYDVIITNPCGSVTSSPASLTLRTAPAIIAQPQGRSVCTGALTTFSVRANGTPPLSYRWRKGGTNIPGATSTTLTISAAQASDAAAYDVVISNSCGSIISSAATLTTRPLRRWYQDIDGDGFGNLSVTRMDCDQPAGYVSAAGDCDDTRGVIHPGSPEICGNSLDDDCDGQIDAADSDCVSSTPNDPVPPPPVPMPTMGGGICGFGSAASGMMCLLFLCGARLGGRSRRRRK